MQRPRWRCHLQITDRCTPVALREESAMSFTCRGRVCFSRGGCLWGSRVRNRVLDGRGESSELKGGVEQRRGGVVHLTCFTSL